MTKTKDLNVMRAAATAAIALMAAGVLSDARADVTDELLQIMRAKGDLTEAQYKTLKARHEAEKAALARTHQSAAKAAKTASEVQQVAVRKEPPPPPAYSGGKDGGWGGNVTYVTALEKGVGVRIGNVEFQTSGDISFFGIQEFGQRHFVQIDGGLLTSGRYNDANSVRGGLLPSSLQFEVRTQQMGLDLAAHFGMFVGGNNIEPNALNANGPGSPFALGTAGVDFRQVYGTIGSYWGTVKVGRDLGLFGGDAILNDATIFGAGTPAGNAAPGDTTLGRIGIGYIYADWLPQITYTTPSWNGLTLSAGLMSPLKTLDASGDSVQLEGQESPMVQGRLKYVTPGADEPCGGFKDAVCYTGPKLTLWTSFVYQDHQADFGDPFRPGRSFTSLGVDGGAKIEWNGFSFVGYGYTGSGIGQTGLFWDAVAPNGSERDSSGGYVQGSYTFFNRLTLGASYGISTLDREQGDPFTLFKFRESEIGFARYKLTNWVAIQGEYIHSHEENHAGGEVDNDAVVLGTTFFW